VKLKCPNRAEGYWGGRCYLIVCASLTFHTHVSRRGVTCFIPPKVAFPFEVPLLSTMSAPPGENTRRPSQDNARTPRESCSSFEMGRLLEAASEDDSNDEEPVLRPEKTDFSPADSQPFPEGGLRAWSVVAGAFFMLLPSFGLMNSVGTFEDYWQGNQLSSYTTRDIGWIPSVFVYLGLALGIQVGYTAMTQHFLLRMNAKPFSDPCSIDTVVASSLQREAWDMSSCYSCSRYAKNIGSFCYA
jgi:hypothetical protein